MRAEKTSSDFIREQPPTMSAAEVVEKGKATGFKFDASLVGKVRRRALSKGAHAKTRAAARSTSTATSPGSMKPVKSKAEFVRGLPSSTPAKEVVAKAKATGISITETYIYGVRAADRRAKKKKSAAKSNASKAAVTAAAIVNGSASPPRVSAKAEALLKAVAAEIGLGNAIEVLQSERARVRGLIGG
jgi:hypothetical protein